MGREAEGGKGGRGREGTEVKREGKENEAEMSREGEGK